jgi:hypothetical protein
MALHARTHEFVERSSDRRSFPPITSFGHRYNKTKIGITIHYDDEAAVALLISGLRSDTIMLLIYPCVDKYS